MYLRRGLFRLMLLATLAWVGYVAYSAVGTRPPNRMPVAVTELADYCRFKFRVSSDMSLGIVRYEASAQYRQARTSARGGTCRAYHQLSEGQVADLAARYFAQWLAGQQLQYQHQRRVDLDAWVWDYLFRAAAPPLLAWTFLLIVLRIGAGTRRREA